MYGSYECPNGAHPCWPTLDHYQREAFVPKNRGERSCLRQRAGRDGGDI